MVYPKIVLLNGTMIINHWIVRYFIFKQTNKYPIGVSIGGCLRCVKKNCTFESIPNEQVYVIRVESRKKIDMLQLELSSFQSYVFCSYYEGLYYYFFRMIIREVRNPWIPIRSVFYGRTCWVKSTKKTHCWLNFHYVYIYSDCIPMFAGFWTLFDWVLFNRL